MDALAPIPPSGSRDADGLRAAELEHAVQGMDGHGDLAGLMTVRARAESIADHPLVAGDRYLAKARRWYPEAFCQPRRPRSAMSRRCRSRWVGAVAAVALGTASLRGGTTTAAAGWRSATTPDTSSRS